MRLRIPGRRRAGRKQRVAGRLRSRARVPRYRLGRIPLFEPLESRQLLAGVTGELWSDRDGDGTRDAGESALSGWTVFHDENRSGQRDDGGELLSRSGPPAQLADLGTTTSRIVVSDGRGTIQDVDVAIGIEHGNVSQLAVTLVKGNTRVPLFGSGTVVGTSLAGTVFDDEASRSPGQSFPPYSGRYLPQAVLSAFDGEDPNGTWTLEVSDQAPGAAGAIVNWQLTVFTVRPAEPAAVTNDEGRFTLANLPAGDVQIRAIQADQDWRSTFPAGGAPHEVQLENDETVDGVDFGFQPLTGVVSGTFWWDQNLDGTADRGESRLSNRTVFVDLNGNETHESDEPQATSDDLGNYRIADLRPGQHVVRAEPVDGWTLTTDDARHVSVAAGQEAGGIDFGSRPLPGKLGGSVWNDLDADGRRSNEPALAGVTVYIDGDDDGAYDRHELSDQTDASGSFLIQSVPHGDHRIRVVPPAHAAEDPGWRVTTAAMIPFELQPGQRVSDLDFGIHRLSRVHVSRFNDENGNGVQEASELGIPGLMLFVDVDANGRLGPAEPQVQTDEHGEGHMDVTAGPWTVYQQGKVGYVAIDVASYQINAESGASQAVAFPNQLSDYGGDVYEDRNANRRRDPGELPLAAAVRLDHRVTRSGPDGVFGFANVESGRHTLHVDPAQFDRPALIHQSHTELEGSVGALSVGVTYLPDLEVENLTQTKTSLPGGTATLAYDVAVEQGELLPNQSWQEQIWLTDDGRVDQRGFELRISSTAHTSPGNRGARDVSLPALGDEASTVGRGTITDQMLVDGLHFVVVVEQSEDGRSWASSEQLAASWAFADLRVTDVEATAGYHPSPSGGGHILRLPERITYDVANFGEPIPADVRWRETVLVGIRGKGGKFVTKWKTDDTTYSMADPARRTVDTGQREIRLSEAVQPGAIYFVILLDWDASDNPEQVVGIGTVLESHDVNPRGGGFGSAAPNRHDHRAIPQLIQVDHGSDPETSADGRLIVYVAVVKEIDGEKLPAPLHEIRMYDRDVDEDGVFDERAATAISRLSAGHDGKPANGDSRDPHVSPNGRYIVFVSAATNLLAHAVDPVANVYLYDRVERHLCLVAAGDNPAVFDDGTVVLTAQIREADGTTKPALAIARKGSGVTPIQEAWDRDLADSLDADSVPRRLKLQLVDQGFDELRHPRVSTTERGKRWKITDGNLELNAELTSSGILTVNGERIPTGNLAVPIGFDGDTRVSMPEKGNGYSRIVYLDYRGLYEVDLEAASTPVLARRIEKITAWGRTEYQTQTLTRDFTLSDDGRTIAFANLQDGELVFHRLEGEAKPFTVGVQGAFSPSFAKGGQVLVHADLEGLYVRQVRHGVSDPLHLDTRLKDGDELRPIFSHNTRISRNGVWMAFDDDAALPNQRNDGLSKIYVTAIDRAPSSIPVEVFHDQDESGDRNGLEKGLAGWHVFLDLDGNRQHDPNEPGAMTNRSGSADLPVTKVGAYDVVVLSPGGWTSTEPGGQWQGDTHFAVQVIDVPSLGLYARPARFGQRASVDFGDAPLPYPTTREADGALHLALPTGPVLGTYRDVDPDGRPDRDARGDDNDALPDDEDGVVWHGPWIPGTKQELEVTVTSSTGTLNAWADFNRDGDWDDSGEHIIDGTAVPVGRIRMRVDVPESAVRGRAAVRFRIATEPDSADGLPLYAGLFHDGEVEDYVVHIDADTDGDGASDQAESTASDHDPDGETEPDKLRRNVATVATDLKAGNWARLIVPSGLTIRNAASRPVPNREELHPDSRVDTGTLQFQVDVQPGERADVQLQLPPHAMADRVMIFGRRFGHLIPHWFGFDDGQDTGAEQVDGQWVLHLKDGGPGDDDLLANGRIVVNHLAPVRVDTTPPVVTSVEPESILRHGRLFMRPDPLTVRLSESVDVTHSAIAHLLHAGANGIWGDLDDRRVTAETRLSADGRSITLRPGTVPEGWLRLTVPADHVRDLMGYSLDGDRDGRPGGDYIHEFILAPTWTNPVEPLDVNYDGTITPLDALIVINALNEGQRGELPVPAREQDKSTALLDASGDGSLTPLDALIVINHLNGAAAGEPDDGSPAPQKTFLVTHAGFTSGRYRHMVPQLLCPVCDGDAAAGGCTYGVDQVDLDIDSDNNNGSGAPDRSLAEDRIEGDLGQRGKLIRAHGHTGSAVPVPMVLSVREKAQTIVVRYSSADDDLGHFRIWTVQDAGARDERPVLEDGHFVAPGSYPVQQLLADKGEVTWYLEAVRPIAAPAEGLISVEALDADGKLVGSDSVLATSYADLVTIAATNAIASETAVGAPTDVGVFTVSRRDDQVGKRVEVHFEITATADDSDVWIFDATGTQLLRITDRKGSVVLDADKASATITVRPRMDDENEGDEYVDITLLAKPDADGELPYQIGNATARVTLLDSHQGTFLSRNTDALSTGMEPDVISDGTVGVGIHGGHVELAPFAPFEFVPSYRDNDNRRPIIVLETELPDGYGVPVAVDAQLEFAGFKADPVHLDTSRLSAAERRVRVALSVPEEAVANLRTGHYAYSAVLTLFLEDGRSQVKTFRGQTELIDRHASGMGRQWSIDGLDFVVASNEISSHSYREGDQEVAPADSLTLQGAATASGFAVMRSNNTSGWYPASRLPAHATVYDVVDLVAADSADPPAGWHRGTAVGGYDGDYWVAHPGASRVVATLDQLSPQRLYQLLALWVPTGARAEDVGLTISTAQEFGRAETEKALTVNQQTTPGETIIEGFHAFSAGFFRPESSEITITIEPGTSAVEAESVVDAFAVVPVDSAYELRTPDGSFASLAADDSQRGSIVLTAPDGMLSYFDRDGTLARRVDRSGNTIQFDYEDQNGDGVSAEVKTITVQGGTTTDFGYEGGKLKSITHGGKGRPALTTSIEQPNGQISEIIFPDPGFGGERPQFEFMYDAQQRLKAVVTERGRTELGYGPVGRANQIRHADGHVTEIDAQVTHGVDSHVLPAASGRIGHPGEDRMGEAMARHQDARGYTWLYQTDRFGLVTGHVDPLDNHTRRERDEHGLVRFHVEPAGGAGPNGPLDAAVTALDYDDDGNLKQVVYPATLYDGERQPRAATESWIYGAFGQVRGHTDACGVLTEYVLDDRGNATEMWVDHHLTRLAYTPAPDSIDSIPGGMIERVTTGILGNSPKDAVTTRFWYYKDGPQTGLLHRTAQAYLTGLEKTTEYGWDDFGHLRTIKDEFNDTTVYQSDRLGRLVHTVPPKSVGEPSAPQGTRHEYDQLGSLVAIVNPRGERTQFRRDAMGRVTEQVMPAPGTVNDADQWMPGGAISKTSRTYYADGRIASTTDADQAPIRYVYDPRGLLTSVSQPAADSVTHFVFDARGDLEAVEDPRGNITRYRYDARHNRVLQIDPRPAEGAAPTARFGFDPNRNLASIAVDGPKGELVARFHRDARELMSLATYPGGLEFHMDYDPRENLVGIRDEDGTLLDSRTYDIRDRLLSWERPGVVSGADPANPRFIKIDYDKYDPRVRTQRDQDVTDVHYDRRGRPWRVKTFKELQTGNWTQREYTYDEQASETTVHTSSYYSNREPFNRQTMVYDELGRMLVMTTVSLPLSNPPNPDLPAQDSFKKRSVFTYSPGGKLTDVSENTVEFKYYTDATIEIHEDRAIEVEHDARGQTTSYRETVDGVTRETDQRHGEQVWTNSRRIARELEYDAAGNARIERNTATGEEIEYQWDELNRLSRVILPATETQHATSLRFQYDILSNLTAITDPERRTSGFSTNDLGQLTGQTVAGSTVAAQRTYDDDGNPTAHTDARGNSTTFQPGPFGPTRIRRPVTPPGSSQPVHATTSYEYDDQGRVVQEIDPLGRVTSAEYDRHGRRTRVFHDLAYLPYERTLDDSEAVLEAPGGSWSGASGAEAFQGAYHVTETGGATATWTVSDLSPHKNYLLLASWLPSDRLSDKASLSVFDGTARVLSTVLDQTELKKHAQLDGRPWQRLGLVSTSSGSLTIVLGNTDGKRLTADAIRLVESVRSEYVTYDGDQQSVASRMDGLGNVTEYTSNQLTRQVTVTRPDGSSTELTFNELGILTEVRDSAGNHTRYVIDAGGRTIAELIDDDGRTVASTAEFDGDGTLRRRTDRNGRVRTYDYDALNRPVKESWYADSDDADNERNVQNTLHFEYNKAGQLVRVRDDHSSYRFAYDALGRRVSTTSDNPGTPSVTLTSVFDHADAHPAEISATIDGRPDFVNRYAYDGQNRVSRIAQTGRPQGNPVADKVVELAYALDGRTETIRRWNDIGQTEFVTSTTHTYNDWGRLQSIVHADSSGEIASYQFTADAAGRLTEIRSIDGVARYRYDPAGQLLEADYDNRDGESYSYDSLGNHQAHEIGTRNRLLNDGVYRYQYDTQGNRVLRTPVASGETTRYKVDHNNRLVRITTLDQSGVATHQADYTYDVFGRRIAKSVDADGAGPERKTSEYYAYHDQHIVLQFDGDGRLTRRNLFGEQLDQILAQEHVLSTGATTVYWQLADHQQSVRDIVHYDATNGQVVVANHVVYDAFGSVVAETDPLFDYTFGFTGREYDEESNLYYLRARYYDAAGGRFLSEDPLQFEAGDANLYRYALNSPTNLTDPTGEIIPLLLGIGLLGAAAIDYYTDQANEEIDFEKARFSSKTGDEMAIGDFAEFNQTIQAIQAEHAATTIKIAMYTAGGLAAPYMLLGSAATASFTGFLMGAADGALSTYAADPNASLGDYAFATGLNGLFGAVNPWGAGAGLAGGIGGGLIEAGAGGDFLGTGYLVGSTIGSIGFGTASTFRSALQRGGGWYAAAAVAPEILGAAGGGAAGYALSDGHLNMTLLGAGLGNAVGGIFSSFVKCFVADTPILVAPGPGPDAWTTVAGVMPRADGLETGTVSWHLPVGIGLVAGGLMLWARGRTAGRRRGRVELIDACFAEQDGDLWPDRDEVAPPRPNL